ncbi:MAG: GGDEF domain-containing protein [Blautia sp.]|nr:GGDEF domain-containing protein [Blautia sp.]
MKIAVLIGGIAHEVQKRLLEGVVEYAREQEIDIFAFICNGDIYRQSEYGIGEFQIYSLPDFSRFDGIVFVRDTIQSEQHAQAIAERITASGTPVVSIDSHTPGMPVLCVDNKKAMKGMLTHLIETHGAMDICYLSGPKQNPESSARLSGALEALEEHGISLPSERIVYGNYWIDSGEALVRTLVEEDRLPDAIVCANDNMALGVYTELARNGIRPGEDVLLTGFDHVSDAAELIPAITTVEKPQERIGYEACKMLAEGCAASRTFSVRYCYRGSCGCRERHKYNASKLQLQNAMHRLSAVSMADINKNMASDLNDCDSFEEFCECLKTHIALVDFSFAYLCLCEEKESEDKMEYDYQEREEYTERVYIPIAYEQGMFTEYPYFPSREILPEECRRKVRGEVCIVAPLHFRKNCLGYAVMCGSDMVYNSTQFQNWFMNIASALENVRRQSKLKRLVKKLNRVWMMDSLTQIYNRAGFFHYAKRIVEECRQKEIPIGILFADINRLKTVNDTYGHEEGDFYIKSVADMLKKLKKDGQLLMRYGGDEFVILGKNETGTEFDDLMEKLNPKLAEHRQQNNKEYVMSVSVGFQSVLISEDFKLDQLMEQADREMYNMKKKR